MIVTNMIVGGGDGINTLDFEVVGEPESQNGWKVAHKRFRIPIVYDPKAKAKKALKRLLISQIAGLNGATPFFTRSENPRLSVRIGFYFKTTTRKDLDNMAKFILDAMKEACYEDDRFIYNIVLFKEETGENEDAKTVVTIVD